jgi:hypothetical protein
MQETANVSIRENRSSLEPYRAIAAAPRFGWAQRFLQIPKELRPLAQPQLR